MCVCVCVCVCVCKEQCPESWKPYMIWLFSYYFYSFIFLGRWGQSGHCPHVILLFCACEKGGCVPEYRKMCGGEC